MTAAASPPPGPRPDDSILGDAGRVAAVDRTLAAGPARRVVQRLTSVAAQLIGTPCAQVSLITGTTARPRWGGPTG